MLAEKCQVRGAPGSPGDQATQGTCSEKVSSSSVSIRPPGGRTYSFDLRTRFEPYNKIGRRTQLSWSVLATDPTAPHTEVNGVHNPQGKSQCLSSSVPPRRATLHTPINSSQKPAVSAELPKAPSPCPPAREHLLFPSLLCLIWLLAPGAHWMLWRGTPLEPEGAMHTAPAGEGKGPNTLPSQERDRSWSTSLPPSRWTQCRPLPKHSW